ncbi:hypothetical protein [Aliarcobacter butzleri]|uniref:hypothetical protein n=1 Tax=Aliarcobacter butzleri TaxID=28197 RepID=UPI003AF7B796
MTKANKTVIKDKILDLREKIQQQSRDLHKQIEQKTKRFENLLDNADGTNPIATMSGVFALVIIYNSIIKGYTLQQLKESLQVQNLLQNKNNLVDKLYHQVNERLDIIEKAENKDLKEFLKDNDVYSVFGNGKIEEFLNNDKSKDNSSSKENDKKKDIDKEISHDR